MSHFLVDSLLLFSLEEGELPDSTSMMHHMGETDTGGTYA